MIDIHAHILPFVDDGSSSFEQSIEMIERASKLGVKGIVLTPHYRFDYCPSKEVVENTFNQLKRKVNEKGIEVNLYLGQEFFIDRNYKENIFNGNAIAINGSKYILIEFDLQFECNIIETVYEICRLGYIPIIAHLERYFYADLETAFQIKKMGGLLQVNATSIVGKEKRQTKKLAKQMFKFGLVDFVASDLHSCRDNLMGKAYLKVAKKYGNKVAERVFVKNAQKILEG